MTPIKIVLAALAAMAIPAIHLVEGIYLDCEDFCLSLHLAIFNCNNHLTFSAILLVYLMKNASVGFAE